MSKVSIIIPIYNVQKYLGECLDSIIGQTYRNLEIICVNDGSTDESSHILDEYAIKDCRIVVIHQKNAGVSAARNNALRQASGDYVMFVDADDWLDRAAVEKTLHYVIQYNLDICSFSYISEHGKVKLKRALFGENVLYEEQSTCRFAHRIIGPVDDELLHPLMLDSYGTIWAKLYRRAIIADLIFEDLKVIGSAEDSLFNMYAYRQAKRTGYLHEFFYHYRKTNAEAQTTTFRPWLRERWKVQYSIIRRSFPDELSQQALLNRIAINCYGLTCSLMASEHPRTAIKEALCDPIFNTACKQLRTDAMPVIWRFFFNNVKCKNVTIIMLFHKVVKFAENFLK